MNITNITNLANIPTITDITYLANSIRTLIMIYLPVYFVLRIFTKQKYLWELFTRGISICNSVNCIWLVYNYAIPNYKLFYDLNYGETPHFINGLYLFSAYLLIDGLFYLPEFIYTPSIQMLTTILHHFVGGIGIYVIAYQNRGIGLAAYFALTEISTPLLHVSWVLYTKKINNKFSKTIFALFYLVFGLARICTIPVLIHYLYINSDLISNESSFHYWMVYIGSGTLICLNLLWYTLLTSKVSKMLLCAPKQRRKKSRKLD